jgi:hypothetical protein
MLVSTGRGQLELLIPGSLRQLSLDDLLVLVDRALILSWLAAAVAVLLPARWLTVSWAARVRRLAWPTATSRIWNLVGYTHRTPSPVSNFHQWHVVGVAIVTNGAMLMMRTPKFSL